MSVRPASLRDVPAFADHIVLHMAESGKDGSPVFSPARQPDRDEVRDNTRARWERPLSVPAWCRAWLLEVDGTARIVGHIELRGGRIAAELHRASLGMGIERAFTGRGHGRRLLDAAIGWARAETPIAWIDLGVFTGNAPAMKLYERAGFIRQYLRTDAFRNEDGTSIDDCYMSLALR
jgi:RimJ/RimL family protein N-acetyltransferase